MGSIVRVELLIDSIFAFTEIIRVELLIDSIFAFTEIILQTEDACLLRLNGFGSK